jgi:hypothetical protein
MKENPKLPEDATLMEKLLQLFSSGRISASSLSSSSKASKILFGSHIWTMII